MNCRRSFLTALWVLLSLSVTAQTTNDTIQRKCGTVPLMQKKLQASVMARKKFEQRITEFNARLTARNANRLTEEQAVVYIPVVFHIVLPNPNIVTDAQIQAQLDTLNRDFAGANGDSVKIPDWFKPLWGKSGIQFCLAQRTPDGDPANGIERVVTNNTSFGIDDAVKHAFYGGADSWNTDKYMNVWVCMLGDNLLGYSSFPDLGDAADQGVVIDYRSLPGGAYTHFNTGKTLTHETGHFFNLYHIWGDDEDAADHCSGSDDVDDTPNQEYATNGCFSGVRTDNCTSAANGVMYQNYMDYSDDDCLVMFTVQQVARMEYALSFFRPTLLSSDGCQPVILKNFNAELKRVNEPGQRICAAGFTPQVTIKNEGSEDLNSLQISASIDGGPANVYPWTGTVTSYNSVLVTLNNLTTTPGHHTLTIYVSDPNNNTDEDRSNDTLRLSFEYFPPVNSVTESFEAGFPPQGWDVVNPDNSITWELADGVAKTGTRSVTIDNYDYDRIGQQDDLRMPLVRIPASVDSAFLSFQVAAGSYTETTAAGNNWDTLDVLVSTDCGANYTRVYRKWGAELVTRKTPTTLPFVPTSSQWRKDSVDLSSFKGSGPLLITFRNTTGFENNIYLDDVNFRTVTVNPNLKEQGFLVTPNPARGQIEVQFYPQPANLRGIQVYNGIGQKIKEIRTTAAQASNYYSFDLSRCPAGIYTVRTVFTDHVVTKKIIKL